MNLWRRLTNEAEEQFEHHTKMGDNSEIEEALSDTEEMEDIEYDSDATVMSEDIFDDNGEFFFLVLDFILHFK